MSFLDRLFKRSRPDDEEKCQNDVNPAPAGIQKTSYTRERMLKGEQPRCYRCGREPSEELKNGEYWCAWCGQAFNPQDASTDANRKQEEMTQTALEEKESMECFNDSLHSNDKTPEVDTTRNLYDKGVEYAIQEKFKKAKEEFEKALKVDQFYTPAEQCLNMIKDVIEQKIKRETAIHFFNGVSYGNKGQYDQAIIEFGKALEINPMSVMVHLTRGYSCQKKGQYNKAISNYNKALEIDPKNAAAYNNRGKAYDSKGEYSQAVSDYNKALEINPRHADAYLNRGNAYSSKDQYDQAISDYNKALEINPRDADAYYNRGNTYRNKNQFNQAISDYNKALEINQRHADAYLNRGLVYESKKQYGQAISNYNKALEINPKDAKGYNNRGVAYYFKGEYGKARKDAHKAQDLGYQVHPGFLKALREASIGGKSNEDSKAAKRNTPSIEKIVPTTEGAFSFSLGCHLGVLQIMVDAGTETMSKAKYETISSGVHFHIEHLGVQIDDGLEVPAIIETIMKQMESKTAELKVLYSLGLTLSDFAHPGRPLRNLKEIEIQSVLFASVGLDVHILDPLLVSFKKSPPPSIDFSNVLQKAITITIVALNKLGEGKNRGGRGGGSLLLGTTRSMEIKSDFCVQLLRQSKFTLKGLDGDEILTTTRNSGGHKCTLMVLRDKGVAASLENPIVDRVLLKMPDSDRCRPLIVLITDRVIDVFDCDQSQVIFDSV